MSQSMLHGIAGDKPCRKSTPRGEKHVPRRGERGRRFGIFMVKNYDNVVLVFILTKQ